MHQHITQNSIATHKNIINVQAAAQKIVINNGRHMKLIFMLDKGTLHLPKRPDKAFAVECHLPLSCCQNFQDLVWPSRIYSRQISVIYKVTGINKYMKNHVHNILIYM